MKKSYCLICSKYRKFENPKTSYLLEKTLVFLYNLQQVNNKYIDETWNKNKKLVNWRNRSKCIDELKAQKDLHNSKLY